MIVREKQLYKLISDETKGNQNAAIELLKDLESSSTSYITINDFDLWSDDDVFDNSLEESIRDLRLFRVTQCNPLLLNAINILTSSKDVARVFRVVANFSFRYFIIGNQSPGNLERETNKIAVGIRTGVLATASDIANSFRSINPDSTFKSDFSLSILSKSRSKIVRYALAKINNHMAAQIGSHGKEQVVNPDSRQVNLEHVLPQSLPPTWRVYFSPQIDPADFIYRLGNMTLLTKKVNANVGDTSFVDKQQQAFNDSGLPINHAFKTLAKWGNTEIEQRQVNMAKLALEIWWL